MGEIVCMHSLCEDVHLDRDQLPLIERIVELLEERRAYREAHPITRDPFTLKPGFRAVDAYPPGASQRAIGAFEKKYNCKLPDDLRAWLRITNGAAGYLGVDTAERGSRISEIWESYPDWKKSNWIPIARDDFGNYCVALADKSTTSPVAFFEGIGSEYPRYLVGSDVLHFVLLKLLEFKDVAPGSSTSPWPFGREYVLKLDPSIEHLNIGVPLAWD